MTIEIIKAEGTTDLYCRYRGQTNPQPVYIELDPDTKKVSASYSPEIGNAVPAAVWHGRILRWGITAGIPTADVSNEIMADLLPQFTRIIAGYSEYWDGSNDRGRLTDDAEAASEEIASYLYSLHLDTETDTVGGIDAADWLENDSNADLGITATTTDAELAALAERIEADTDERMILEDLDRELERRRDVEKEKED